MDDADQVSVFAYGSLQVASVIRHVVGRVPDRVPARLVGYARYRMRGKDYPGIVAEPGSVVEGVRLDGITGGELAALDRYEDPVYRRLRVEVRDGEGRTCSAHAYVVPDSERAALTDQPWNLSDFQRPF